MPFNSPLQSPIALNKPQQSPSIFKKRLANASAASYLSVLSQADARARSNGSVASSTSTPALSLSSSITSSSEDTILHEDEYLTDPTLASNADGLLLPLHPPTSEQVFTTVHTEFGHCANEEYRTTSQHKQGASVPAHVEQDPPYYILLSTYISYLILIVLGHVRDFVGKRLSPASYKHLMPRGVSVQKSTLFILRCRENLQSSRGVGLGVDPLPNIFPPFFFFHSKVFPFASLSACLSYLVDQSSLKRC